ncbi:MAG TPA: hypothetical protein VHL53_09115 [Acidimicrobiia bacterium]|nr:hypothetical protein [Acidimicrobiia bacterium]
MSSSLASREDARALAAAMSRHPAAGVRPALPAPAGPPSFATVAGLLTGPWRVNDPVGFAAAMRAAPLVAGHPVVDLCACARQPTVGLDPLSAALAGHLETAVGAAAVRAGLGVRWVAAQGGRFLFVEAAGRAPADDEGPELLLLAHLVEPGGPGPGAPAVAPVDDDSWLVAVVGDGRGGVAGIGRAPLAAHLLAGTALGPAGSPGRRDRPPARLALAALRARLVGAARAAEGLDPDPGGESARAVVLPFRR